MISVAEFVYGPNLLECMEYVKGVYVGTHKKYGL